jgi:hypothetical protein
MVSAPLRDATARQRGEHPRHPNRLGEPTCSVRFLHSPCLAKSRLARQLLARARAHSLSDVVQPWVITTKGVIRLEEGKPREARPLLEQAFEMQNKLRHASTLVGAELDKMHAALARPRAISSRPGDTTSSPAPDCWP